MNVEPLVNIEMVVFDWGGVILRHCRSWAEACRHAKMEIRAGYEAPELVQERRRITQEFQCGRIEPSEHYRRIARATGNRYSPEEVERIHDAWLLDEYAGVAEVIAAIHASAVQTALLSNTNEAHWARHLPKGNGKPADFPTAGLVMHRHASHLLGHAKPGAEIYHAFEKQVGVRASQVLFFDDVAENVATARTLGWRAELIDYTQETSPQIVRGLRTHGVLGHEPTGAREPG